MEPHPPQTHAHTDTGKQRQAYMQTCRHKRVFTDNHETQKDTCMHKALRQHAHTDTCAHRHAHLCSRTHTHRHTHAHLCSHTDPCTHMHISHMDPCTHTHMHMCSHTDPCTHTHAHLCSYTDHAHRNTHRETHTAACVHTFMHTHTHRDTLASHTLPLWAHPPSLQHRPGGALVVREDGDTGSTAPFREGRGTGDHGLAQG